MNAQTFFSVIVPTFNRKNLLKKAVDSVLNQTFHDFELIIIDDGSADGTNKLIGSYDDSRIKYIYQDNAGVSSARNSGLSIASGTFVAFLDSDDFWVPEKLEKTHENIQRFPRISIFHTEEIWYRNGKLLNQKKKHKKPSGLVYTNALALCCISISTAVIKKDVFESVGCFDENMEACEDYDFWLRVTHKYEVKLIPEKLTIKDGGRDDQLSSRIWGLDRFRIKSLEKMLVSGTLNSRHRNATLKELRKKCRVFAAGAEKRGKIKETDYYRTLPEKYIF